MYSVTSGDQTRSDSYIEAALKNQLKDQSCHKTLAALNYGELSITGLVSAELLIGRLQESSGCESEVRPMFPSSSHYSSPPVQHLIPF